ncbi:uncharacterized protein [Drosophila takahashii]|uniref:uncharacterized protein n=1 Tax=Drosophila takahashii TaxID=29030 RepID=UPI001CF87D6B|nr:uncharacterized protein LOC123002411 [Drosophila takahashii]
MRQSARLTSAMRRTKLDALQRSQTSRNTRGRARRPLKPLKCLAMALLDDLHDDGRLLSEKWEEIEVKVADMIAKRLSVVPNGPIPSFDSSDMVSGHRVIKCDDSFSRSFLAECIAKIGNAWEGLSIRLVHAREIPRRPRTRIWLPKEQTDPGKVLSLLRAQNPEVHTED